MGKFKFNNKILIIIYKIYKINRILIIIIIRIRIWIRKVYKFLMLINNYKNKELLVLVIY